MIRPASRGSLQPIRTNYSQQQPLSRGLLERRDVLDWAPRTEHLVHYREARSPRGIPTYIGREQRQPEVVRGSPSLGLKDMLVPSIETSSDESNERRKFGLSGPQQDAYSQHQLLPPAPPRQVIVIEDSPEVKRRRVIHDDMPHIVRQPELPVSSSVHSRDFISQPQQRFPVYETAPSNNFNFVQNSRDNSRRYEEGATKTRVLEPARSMTAVDSHRDRQRVFTEPSRYTNNPGTIRPLVGSEVFQHEHHEHRVVPPPIRGRDASVSFPINAYGDHIAHGTARSRSEDQSGESFITLRRAQDMSPRPVERPL